MKAGGAARELAAVLAFTALLFVPFMGKAYHIDEPWFMAPAAQILRDPLHPFSFDYNWVGHALPFGRLNVTPPLMYYALALGVKATGGLERAMRLFFFPADLLTAAALYFLARRFLARPLLPTLIALASPAYWINLGHLHPEKLVAMFGLFALAALVRSLDKKSAGWFWLSAAALAAALLTKYAAVLFLGAALVFLYRRGSPARRLAAYAACALLPLAGYMLLNLSIARDSLDRVYAIAPAAARGSWPLWIDRWRAFLACVGGCALPAGLWSLSLLSRRAAIAISCAAALLFIPVLDIEPARFVDRATGWFFSSAALAALAAAWNGRRRREGALLWLPWLACAVLVQLALYWTVLARIALFSIVPLILLAASALESSIKEAPLRRIYAASLGGAVALGLCLSLVDHRFAGLQRSFAEETAGRYLSAGRRVWFTGHWGFQYYMERAGALPIDRSRGGWDEVRAGDIVLLPRVNSNMVLPTRPGRWRRAVITKDSAIPLRLISFDRSQAGFYSSGSGFLPFSVSREPLEEFSVVEAL